MDEKEMLKEIRERIDESRCAVDFCPLCGSYHLGSFGFHDELFGKDRQDISCGNCGWRFIIFVEKEGKRRFKLRQDRTYDDYGTAEQKNLENSLQSEKYQGDEIK